MFSNLRYHSTAWLDTLTAWADPWWWVWASVIIFFLCVVHPVPLKLPEEHVYSFKAHVGLWMRRITVALFFAVVLILPLVTYILFGMLSRENAAIAANLFNTWTWEMTQQYWTAPAAALLAGLGTASVWHRYVDPHLSNFFRRFRVRQGEDEPSDVKKEAGKIAPKKYDPTRYFKPGVYFLGLDENNQPIYVSDADFHSKHGLWVGPTQTGKGVEFGVVLAQAIRKGNAVFYLDPKDDKYVPFIMAQAAKEAERPFIFLDLNPDGQGNWHPFKGGSPRGRRSRIVSAFKLEDGGSDADVFKVKERGLLDAALQETDGSVRAILEYVKTQLGDDAELSKLRDSLQEWARISTFTPQKKNRGHSIEQSIKNNAVVYVRGSIDDEVIRLAMRCYLAELIQEAKRLAPERSGQLSIAVDEVRFLVSPEVVTGLAAVAQFNTNMILATQAFSDLRNITDRTIDKQALQQSFTINCKIKLLYQAGDDVTAQWGEIMGGTTWLRTPAMERTEVNRWGGEKWSDNRVLQKIEAPLVSQNRLLTLPAMVGILYLPGQIAQTLFTAPVPVDTTNKPWEKAKQPMHTDDANDITPSLPVPTQVEKVITGDQL